MPENTIEAFKKATDLGCDHLELDVVISGDGQVVVSHEPWMRASICTTAEGARIAEDEAKSLNLYRMTVEEIQRCDCGSLAHPDHPAQLRMKAFKPTLMQVVEATDEFALLNGNVSPSYTIELKSDPAWYGIHQPEPAEMVRIVMATIDSLGMADRCILQSFDPAILEALHAGHPDIPLAFLVEEAGTLDQQLARLSFVPAIYSPHFSLANDDLLTSLRTKQIELVVWTVNEPGDIKRMIDLGVDGIISDYPDRVFGLLDGRE